MTLQTIWMTKRETLQHPDDLMDEALAQSGGADVQMAGDLIGSGGDEWARAQCWLHCGYKNVQGEG